MTDIIYINGRYFTFPMCKTHSICKRTLKLLKIDKEYEWKVNFLS